jgi:hypothetical protein
MIKTKTCVIICYWTGRSTQRLHQLLNQMLTIDAGTDFNLAIVCNGGDKNPLTLPKKFDALRPQIFNRENVGLNIMAWDYGWRAVGDYEYYLFLQDECFLKKTGWVSEFEYRMSADQGIGLLGEYIMWPNMTWQFIRQATDRDLGVDWFPGESVHPLDFYQNYMTQQGISTTEIGSHLMCLVIFTKLSILQEINGFLPCKTYREAISSEIALSRLIASKGYRISYVKDERFVMIGHYQWTQQNKMKIQFYDSLKNTKIYSIYKKIRNFIKFN